MTESRRADWRFLSQGPEQTREAGRRLAASIGSEGAVLCLCGELGAGKSELVRGLAEGMRVAPGVVSSPTFTIVNEYETPDSRPRLAHVDFYRLEREDELDELGFFDLLEPGVVVAVEWGDRFPSALAGEGLEVRLARLAGKEQDPASGELRCLEVAAKGPGAREISQAWADALSDLGRVEVE